VGGWDFLVDFYLKIKYYNIMVNKGEVK